MATIVPRWEWRSFGSSFGRADASIDRLATGEAEESDERYFLGPGTGNVKVRDDLIDVKLLREVDADGLQRWEPVLKAPLPLAVDDVRVVLDALAVTAPQLGLDAYSLDQLAREVLGSIGTVRSVTVHKRRTRFTVDDCAAEIADVSADGRTVRTVAMESEDPAAVVRGLDRLGLRTFVNTSYPAGLAVILDAVPERDAVIDVGTNSVKFLVAERTDDGWRSIVDRAEVTRLGEDLQHTGVLAATAIDRTADAIAAMAEQARDLHARAIAAVGTAGMRIARNTDDAITAFRARAGVIVEVITGQEEGRLAYVAVRTGLRALAGTLVIFDTGGGSSQFTFGEGGAVRERFSLDVGAVRFTERFGLDHAVSEDVVREAREAVAADLAPLRGRDRPDALVGMGGAVTNMTAVALELEAYDPGRVQGATLARDEVERQIERYRSVDADERRAIVGLQPKRAEVILAGACVVVTVMELLGVPSLIVSDRGVRHGLLIDRFGA